MQFLQIGGLQNVAFAQSGLRRKRGHAADGVRRVRLAVVDDQADVVHGAGVPASAAGGGGAAGFGPW